MNHDVVEHLSVQRSHEPSRPDSLGTSALVAAIVGDNYQDARQCERMIHYWRMAGAITPSIRVAAGSGSWVRWSISDVDRVRKIWALRQQMHRYDMKLSTLVVSEMWKALREGRPWTMRIELDLDQNDLSQPVTPLGLNP